MIIEKTIDGTIRAITNIGVTKVFNYLEKSFNENDFSGDDEPIRFSELIIKSIKIIDNDITILNTSDDEFIGKFIIEKLFEKNPNYKYIGSEFIQKLIELVKFYIRKNIEG